MQTSFFTLLLSFGLASFVVCLLGCGESSDLVAVTGRVTLDDKPLSGVLVEYFPAQGGSSAVGRTNEQGSLCWT